MQGTYLDQVIINKDFSAEVRSALSPTASTAPATLREMAGYKFEAQDDVVCVL